MDFLVALEPEAAKLSKAHKQPPWCRQGPATCEAVVVLYSDFTALLSLLALHPPLTCFQPAGRSQKARTETMANSC